jgi:hypothetical protein
MSEQDSRAAAAAGAAVSALPVGSTAERSNRVGKDLPGAFDNLLRIEAALNLHFNSRRPNNLISFDNMYYLLNKVSSTPVTTASMARGRPNDADRDLTAAERQLYSLLRVTIPVLYNVCCLTEEEACQQRSRAILSGSAVSGMFNGASSASLPSPEQGSDNGRKRQYFVEQVPFPGNRMAEFRRLLWRCGDVSAVVDDDVLRAIRKHAASRMKASTTLVPAPAPTPTDQALEDRHQSASAARRPLIRVGMTIDERVRAREEARLKRDTDAASANAEAMDSGQTAMDRSWLLRLTDALWRHSADILARQNRFQSPQRKRKVTFCTLTLKDAVSVLSKALSRPGMPVATGKKSSRALADAILELTKLVPNWIQVAGSGTRNGDDIFSKDTTVWIYHAQYKEARSIVRGKPTVASASLKNGTALLSDASHTFSKKSDIGFRSKRTFETPLESASQPYIVTAEDDPAGPFLPKKQRFAGDSHAALPPRSSLPKKPLALHALTPAPKNRDSSLRINPHLILSDADYSTYIAFCFVQVQARGG